MKLRVGMLVVAFCGVSLREAAAVPVTLPADQCITFAELKAKRQPLYHNNQPWFDQARNITCKYEVSNPTYGAGRVIVVGNCKSSSNCDANCGTSTPPNVNDVSIKIGSEVQITQQDTWNTTINVSGGFEWGNENSASSLIFGAAKAKIEAGWEYSWGGSTGTQVTVGDEETLTLNPCKWIRRYSYGAYRSGANASSTISVTVTWDEHCTVHNAWYNGLTSPLGSGSSSVNVTYMIGSSCSANLGSGTCTGATATGMDTATACPGNDTAIRQLCGFEPNKP